MKRIFERLSELGIPNMRALAREAGMSQGSVSQVLRRKQAGARVRRKIEPFLTEEERREIWGEEKATA